MSPRFPLLLGFSAFAVASLFGWSAAQASPVTATLSAQYFEVAGGTDPDFPGPTPTVLLGSTLGPNGLPVSTGGSTPDVNPGTNEITWWSPSLNSNVTATGSGTISLPYSSNMYAPNSTGTNDATEFETAVFTGTFTLSAAEAVEFQLGSDDDSFIYVDGILIGSNPGIHAVTNVDFTSAVLPAGVNSIEVFYDDREQIGAYLSLDLLTSGVVITPIGVPEPGTLALLGTGLAGLAFFRRRQKRSQSAA